MIRRPHVAADGRQQWVLISQVEHARLAGELATPWGAEPFAPPQPRDEALGACFHHDDGWAEWERVPEVDPQHGRPYNFTEMPLATAIAIWRRSIHAAERIVPLAAYLVSGHFDALLRRSNDWQNFARPESPLAQDFFDEQNPLRRQWFTAWQAVDPATRTQAMADLALRHLQFFDALSLWFCTAERREPHTVDVPGGPKLTLTPGTDGTIGLSPWPLRTSELLLEVPGRVVSATQYSSAKALQSAPSDSIHLSWRLVPGGPGPAGRSGFCLEKA